MKLILEDIISQQLTDQQQVGKHQTQGKSVRFQTQTCNKATEKFYFKSQTKVEFKSKRRITLET